MELFSRLFNRSQKNGQIEQVDIAQTTNELDEEWEAIPGFIEAEPADYHTVSVIASAIAAGAYPESKFVVKRILQRNPEALKLTLIAASLAAEISTDSQLIVKKIYQKKS